jgi:hypothetical protein
MMGGAPYRQCFKRLISGQTAASSVKTLTTSLFQSPKKPLFPALIVPINTAYHAITHRYRPHIAALQSAVGARRAAAEAETQRESTARLGSPFEWEHEGKRLKIHLSGMIFRLPLQF